MAPVRNVIRSAKLICHAERVFSNNEMVVITRQNAVVEIDPWQWADSIKDELPDGNCEFPYVIQHTCVRHKKTYYRIGDIVQFEPAGKLTYKYVGIIRSFSTIYKQKNVSQKVVSVLWFCRQQDTKYPGAGPVRP